MAMPLPKMREKKILVAEIWGGIKKKKYYVHNIFTTVRDHALDPFYRMLCQTHVNGWSRVIASQNGGSTDYISPLD